MNNKYNIQDIGKLIKLAREKSLKGIYHESLDLYKISMDLIQERIKTITDTNLKEQWFKSGQNIKSEYLELKEIIELCMTFRMDKKEENNSKQDNQMILRDYLDNGKNNNNNYNDHFKRLNSNDDRNDRGDRGGQNSNNNNQNNNDKNINEKKFERFGGKVPFEHHRGHSYEKNENNQGQQNNNINFNKDNRDRQDSFKDNKDKDFKDDIRKLLPKKNSSNIGVINNNIGKGNKPYSQQLNIDPEKKRNYEKPWKGNEEDKKDNKKKGKEDKTSGKSAFFLHHYPDGDGPDANLIEMLETEIVDKNPSVSFDDIAELDAAKNVLKEAVLLPLLMPEFFTGIRRPWKGVLLYGPPGTGKTMLAKALATQGKCVFFNVSASTFASKWRGESEKLIRLLFEMARFYAPTTIFIDEVDSIGSKRGDGDGEASRRVKSELLVQMDGVNITSSANTGDKENKIVMVMGATNRPWDLDEALRRRFEKRVYIPLPNETGRLEMYKINLKGVTCESNIDWDKIVKLSEGYSGADISNVCREASLMQMRRRLLNNSGDILNIINKPNFEKEIQAPISESDLIDSLKNISKSVSKKDLDEYDKWTTEFKSS